MPFSLLLVIYRHQMAGRGWADCLPWFLATADMQPMCTSSTQLMCTGFRVTYPLSAVRSYEATRQGESKVTIDMLYFRMSSEGHDRMGSPPQE